MYFQDELMGINPTKLIDLCKENAQRVWFCFNSSYKVLTELCLYIFVNKPVNLQKIINKSHLVLFFIFLSFSLFSIFSFFFLSSCLLGLFISLLISTICFCCSDNAFYLFSQLIKLNSLFFIGTQSNYLVQMFHLILDQFNSH